MFLRINFVFIAVCTIHLAKAAVSTRDNPEYTKIVYPGPIQDLKTRYGNQNTTDPCKGVDFCTLKPNDYPQELFNRIFKGKITEPIFWPSNLLTDDRQGDPDEMDDCESTVTFEPLYRVRTQSGEMRTVVQAPDVNYLQLVRMEKCNKVGSSCFKPFRTPVDLVTLCKQKYAVWEFLVYDGKDGTETTKVDLPICCSCHFKPKE